MDVFNKIPEKICKFINTTGLMRVLLIVLLHIYVYINSPDECMRQIYISTYVLELVYSKPHHKLYRQYVLIYKLIDLNIYIAKIYTHFASSQLCCLCCNQNNVANVKRLSAKWCQIERDRDNYARPKNDRARKKV